MAPWPAGGAFFAITGASARAAACPGRTFAARSRHGIRRLRRRYGCEHFLAYFQPATNTYAPVDRLRLLYEQAASHPQIVGLTIGTRPDCAANEVLDLLDEFAVRTYVSVEFGMQTMHDRSLDWMNRGHHYDAFLDAAARSRGRGFDRGAHVILGLPGESRADMRATADELARLRLDSVKLHNLYAVRNTPLEDQVKRGEVRLLERDEYLESGRGLPRTSAPLDRRRADRWRRAAELSLWDRAGARTSRACKPPCRPSSSAATRGKGNSTSRWVNG